MNDGGWFSGLKETNSPLSATSEGSGFFIKDCHMSSNVPGKEILESIGLVQYIKKEITGDISSEIETIFEDLLNVAKSKGANAVVNVRLTTGSYEVQGLKWQMTFIVAYGEAVILSS